jgi:hypothetical protein
MTRFAATSIKNEAISFLDGLRFFVFVKSNSTTLFIIYGKNSFTLIHGIKNEALATIIITLKTGYILSLL